MSAAGVPGRESPGGKSRCQLSVPRFFAAFALMLFVPFAPGAQTLPAGVTRGPSMGGITEYNLANGLKVLLLPDPSQDTITVNVTYLVGSRHESYGERGMAHLLEHLLFKGTPKIPNPKNELAEARRALQRHHLVRPHQLLRDLPGERRRARLRARPRGRPHGQRQRLASRTSTAR